MRIRMPVLIAVRLKLKEINLFHKKDPVLVDGAKYN